MKWATRKNMKCDRTASYWLVKKFIDSDAEFEYVNEAQIEMLTQNGVLTFDAEKAKYKHNEDVQGGKYGEKCTFQVIMDEYNLVGKDPVLDYMATIIYVADIEHLKINLIKMFK